MIAIDGREASRARRLALSAGKASLPPSTERTRSSSASNGVAVAPAAPAAAVAPVAAPVAAPAPRYVVALDGSTHAYARARRAELSRHGRGNQPAGQSSHRERPKPDVDLASLTVSDVRVTNGASGGPRARVTGEPPAVISEFATAKVGFARTARGLIVSGTLVRSSIRITGDEAGGATVTGEADQRVEDDLTARSSHKTFAQRSAPTAYPHGATVFGTSLGNGRRPKRVAPSPLETTLGGHVVTGSAVGPSVRVTGHDSGQCRPITGDQYATADRAQTACGGTGGGTAAAAHIERDRRDPVTGAKVVVSQTGAGHRMTGFAVDAQSNVTGGRRGLTVGVTGSQYQAIPNSAPATEPAAVTGDIPHHDPSVTGTARGADRTATGTPYFEVRGQKAASANPVGDLNERFSVRSPQRVAHLQACAARAEDAPPPKITGAFAAGNSGITGNVEFVARPRIGANEKPARGAVTGEGSTQGSTITGSAWNDHGLVTGTDGAFSQTRNPSVRAGKQHAFASARIFKNGESRESAKHLVTGTFGYDSAARVTLSGGAQG